MLPYIVWTPPYYHYSAGVRIMHRLVHLLNEAGCEAYATTGIINPKWNEPKTHTFDTNNSIVIYPEIVKGNPLGIHNVVRYVLQTPGLFGVGDSEYPDDNFVVYLSRMFSDTGPYLHLLTIERDLFKPYPKYLRSGNVYWLGTKAKNKPDDSVVKGWTKITTEWPEERADLADLLKRSRALYVWDALSSLTVEATLCGCPVVIMDEGHFSREQIEKTEVGTAGYAWGEQDLPRAMKTLHYAESNYDKLEAQIPKMLQEFIDYTQSAFKRVPTICLSRAKIKVTTFLDSGDNGSIYYRSTMPLNHANQSEKVEFVLLRKGDDYGKIQQSLDADVFYLPRLANPTLLTTLLNVPKAKRVLDYDDDLFHVSPMSTHYKGLGTEEIWFRPHDGGEPLPVWIDGKNINISENRERIEEIKKCMRRADAITVTTPILAEEYRNYNDNVHVIPNLIDLEKWRRLNIVDDGTIRLFWAGGSSHYDDWFILKDVLWPVMQQYPQTRLVLMGSKWDGTIREIPEERVEFYQWVHSEAYPYAVTTLNPHIGLIPLHPNRFSRCKSPIKFMEMSALGVPCVMSYVSPYKEIATEDNGVFIEDNDKQAWISGLSLLIENVHLRKVMGEQARRYVEEHFDAKKKWILYEDFFKEIA